MKKLLVLALVGCGLTLSLFAQGFSGASNESEKMEAQSVRKIVRIYVRNNGPGIITASSIDGPLSSPIWVSGVASTQYMCDEQTQMMCEDPSSFSIRIEAGNSDGYDDISSPMCERIVGYYYVGVSQESSDNTSYVLIY